MEGGCAKRGGRQKRQGEDVGSQSVAVHRGQGETKDRGRPLQRVGGSYNKQGNELARLVFWGCKTNRYLQLPPES